MPTDRAHGPHTHARSQMSTLREFQSQGGQVRTSKHVERASRATVHESAHAHNAAKLAPHHPSQSLPVSQPVTSTLPAWSTPSVNTSMRPTVLTAQTYFRHGRVLGGLARRDLGV